MASNPFQFIAENGSVDNSGNAQMALTQNSNPTSRTRRTNAQIKADTDRILLSVFRALSKYDLCLRKFLVAAFESQHEEVVNKVHKFYGNDGPSTIISLWARKLDLGKYDESFARATIGVVGSRVQADLNNAIRDPYFRHPANSITRKSVKTFSLRRIRNSLDSSASHLTLLLESLLPINDDDDDDPSKWKPRDFAADPAASVRRKKVPWLSTRDDSDAESTSSSTSSSNLVVDFDLNSAVNADPNSAVNVDLNEHAHAESDSDWEQELDPKAVKHHTNAFVVTVACMLLYMRSQKSNRFQVMMGKG